MANQNQPQSSNTIDQLNEQLTGIEHKVENNQKLIMWVSVAVAAIVVIILAYVYLIRKPGVEAANTAIGQADLELAMGNDSLALAQYEQVADDMGYDAANRANLNAAIILYGQGKYQEALDRVKNYSASENIIGATAKALEGDCYVNLKNYDEALECFEKAEKISDENPDLTPYFLLKQANVLHAQQKYADEAEVYEEILDEYPQFGGHVNIDFQKYLDRAKALAESKK